MVPGELVDPLSQVFLQETPTDQYFHFQFVVDFFLRNKKLNGSVTVCSVCSKTD